MALGHSAKCVTRGLVFAFDKDNQNSFKGPTITNIANQLSTINTVTTGISFVGSTESVYIPTIGQVVSKKVSGSNDYGVTSSSCCPNLYYYGSLNVSSSTLYTYAILYKTTSGYTHPNFMYRYEYAGATYVKEGGVHNDTNRIHLGDGWYWAWGSFTTSATTTNLVTYAFYYKYGTLVDNFYVAKVLITPGDYTSLHPSKWPDVLNTRVAANTFYDLTRTATFGANSNVTYSSSGDISFNGSSNYLDLGNPTALQLSSAITISAWVNPVSTSGYGNIFSKFFNSGYRFRVGVNNELWWYVSGNYLVSPYNLVPNNTWTHVAVSGDHTGLKAYVNGVLVASNSVPYAPAAVQNGNAYIGAYDVNTETFNGQIAHVHVYNVALTPAEVKQNFNALRGRFGV